MQFKEQNSGLVSFLVGEQIQLLVRIDGMLCCGYFKDKNLDGQAIIRLGDESYLMGTFKGNEVVSLQEKPMTQFLKKLSQESKGKFKFIKHKTNESVYFGLVDKKGKPDGLGVVVYPDKKLHYGQYRDGKLNGFAVIQLKNDDIYVGQCVDGRIEGYGIFTQKENTKSYLGKFQQGICQEIIENKVGRASYGQYEQLQELIFNESRVPTIVMQDLDRLFTHVARPKVSPLSTQATSFFQSHLQSQIHTERAHTDHKKQVKKDNICCPFEVTSSQKQHDEVYVQMISNLKKMQQSDFFGKSQTDLDSSSREINQDTRSCRSFLTGEEDKISKVKTQIDCIVKRKKNRTKISASVCELPKEKFINVTEIPELLKPKKIKIKSPLNQPTQSSDKRPAPKKPAFMNEAQKSRVLEIIKNKINLADKSVQCTPPNVQQSPTMRTIKSHHVIHYSPPPIRPQTNRSFTALKLSLKPAFVTIRDFPVSHPMITYSFI